jgi:hypothetical protein
MLAGSFGASGEERRTTCWMRASGERTPNLAWVLGHHSPKDGGPRVGVGGPPPRSRPLGTKGGGPRNAGRRLRRLGPRRWDGGRRVAAPRDHRRRSSSPDAWVVHNLPTATAAAALDPVASDRLELPAGRHLGARGRRLSRTCSTRSPSSRPPVNGILVCRTTTLPADVNGSRFQPSRRSFKRSPTIQAVRSTRSATGTGARRGTRANAVDGRVRVAGKAVG